MLSANFTQKVSEDDSNTDFENFDMGRFKEMIEDIDCGMREYFSNAEEDLVLPKLGQHARVRADLFEEQSSTSSNIELSLRNNMAIQGLRQNDDADDNTVSSVSTSILSQDSGVATTVISGPTISSGTCGCPQDDRLNTSNVSHISNITSVDEDGNDCHRNALLLAEQLVSTHLQRLETKIRRIHRPMLANKIVAPPPPLLRSVTKSSFDEINNAQNVMPVLHDDNAPEADATRHSPQFSEDLYRTTSSLRSTKLELEQIARRMRAASRQMASLGQHARTLTVRF